MLDLYPYQHTGVEFLTVRKNALLADEPGLGKTVQAIRAAQNTGSRSILVVCPKSAIGNWRAEFRKWWPGGPTPVVVNYDVFSQKKLNKAATDILRDTWHLVILDEAHRLKSAGSNRTKVVYGKLAPKADRVWLLTGTPTPNHNGELYTHLKALTPDFLGGMGRLEFEDEYCNVHDHPQWGRRINGNRNTDKLKKTIAPFVLRRKKSEVLPDLPPLRFVAYPLQLDEQLPNYLPELPVDIRPDDANAVLAWLKSEEVHLATGRRLLGTLKVPAVAQLIEDELDAGVGKLIVFAHHRAVLDGLAHHFQGQRIARIDGKVPAADRDAAVRAFQEDPECRLFLGQIAACGEALTLTAASEVLFAEFSWTPSENYQAACRAHRIGQPHGVLARFLAVPGSLDETIARVAARKATDIAELFG